MWRGQEGSTGDKQGMRRASVQDLLSLEIQGDGVIAEPLMLDGKTSEREKPARLVCRGNWLCMCHLLFPQSIKPFLYKGETCNLPRSSGRELINPSFGTGASLSARTLYRQAAKLSEM